MIRRAVEEDIPRLVEMGQRFMRETDYREHLSENPAQIALFLRNLLTCPDGAVFVSGSDASLTGTIVLLRFVQPFSGEVIVSELAWWVDPEARGDGVRLLRTAEAWALEHGAIAMQMIAPTPKVERFYERLGYARVEVAYQRRLS